MTHENQLYRRRTVLKLTGGAAVVTSGFAGISIAQSTIVVPDDEPTIQDAVNAASPGDTIEVQPGTYDENVTVDKSITIDGAGQDETILDGDDKTGNGFRIESPGVRISSIKVTGFQNGLNIPANASADNLHLEDVTFLNNARYGIWGPSSTDDFEHVGIILENVTASDHTDEFFSRGVWFMRGVSDLRVTNSEFANNTLVGFDLGDSDAAGSGGHVDVTIDNTVIKENGDVGLAFHDASGVEVTQNNIEGNDVGLLNGGDQTVDATDNWWGHASGPGGEDGRTNPAGKEVGKGDDIEGDVDFDPWLRRPIDHPSR